MISGTNTIVNPRAMVVEAFHTFLAIITMLRAHGFLNLTYGTNLNS